MTDIYTDNDVYEDVPEDTPSSIPWSEKAASTYAMKVGLAAGSPDSATNAQITKELTETGESATADRLKQGIRSQHLQSMVETGATLVPELGSETVTEVLRRSLSQPTSIEEAVQESATQAVMASSEFEWTEDELNRALDEEAAIQNEYQKVRADDEFFSGGVLKGVIDFAGSMVPFSEANSWRRLASDLEEKFGADLPNAAQAYVMQGEFTTAVLDWVTSLGSEEQLEAVQYLQEKLPEYSGFFGDNDFIRNSIISQTVAGKEGRFLEGDTDTDRIVNNIVGVLDIAGTAGAIKSVASVAKRAGSIKSPDSNAAVLERTNPEEAAKLEAQIVATGDEKVANSLGVTQEDIIADVLLPKWEAYGSSPHVNEGFFKEQLKKVRRILGRESEVDLHLTDSERMIQSNNILDKLNKYNINKNSSSIDYIPEGIKVKTLLNLSENKESLSAAKQTLKEIQAKHPEMQGKVVFKNYDGAISQVKDNVIQPRVKLSEKVEEIKGRLASIISNKPVTGATGASKANIAKYSKLQSKLQAQKEALKLIQAERASMSPAKYHEAERAAIRAVEGTQDELRQVDKTTKAAYHAQEAEANLARLEAGKYDQLTGEARSMYTTARKQAVVEDNPLGEYMVELDYVDAYKTGRGDVLLDPDDIHWQGDMAGYFADISAGLAKHLSNSFYRAFERSRGLEKDLVALVKPFTSASNKNKRRILSLLNEGSVYENADGTIGKNFSASEVLAKLHTGISDKDAHAVIQGYLSVRQLADVSHSIMNRNVRQEMLGRGAKHIDMGDAGQTVGSVVEDISNVRVVYNPATRTVEDTTPEMREAWKAQGKQVYKADNLQGSGNNLTHYVLTGGKETVVKELPTEVLNYRAGYIPRIYKDQYFVTMRPKTARVDGEQLSPSSIPERTVAAAKSKAQQARLIEEIKKSNPDMVVEPKHDRFLTSELVREAEMSLQHHTGGLFYSRRGNHLLRENGELADIEDPITGILRMTSSLSRTTELRPVIELHKNRWLSEFGDLNSDIQGVFPTSKRTIVNPKLRGDPRAEKARAYWDYIVLQETSSTTTQWWRGKMFEWGEWLEGKTGSEKVGSFFRTSVAERDPFSVARGTTFLTSIVFNPFRQLFINAQQFMFLYGLDPAGMPDAVRRGSALLMASDDAKVAGAAKWAGMSVDEFKQMNNAFRESGLMEAVDINLIGRDALMSINPEVTKNTAQAVSQATGNVIRWGIGAVRRVGFDTGEMINIANTYVIAQRRWKKANPGKSPYSREAKYEIAADTRQLSFGMTQAGGFKYQKGFMSLPTQFFSVQHKALQMMVGGNKAISKAEARRIAVGQMLLYGATGIGLGSAIDWALDEMGADLSPEARNVLVGGMYDFLLNAAIQGEAANNYEFAGNIAAGGGWADTFLDKLWDFQNVSALELFAGPSATPFSRFGAAFRLTYATFGAAVLSDEYEVTPERAKLLMHTWASTLSLYNNIWKASAMHHSDSFVDKAFNAVGVKADVYDATIRGLLGVGTYEESGYYDVVISASAKRKKLKETADVYYTNLSRLLATELASDSPKKADAIIAIWEAEYAGIAALIGKEDARQVALLMEDLVKQRTDKGHGALVELVAKYAQNGALGDSYETVINNMLNAGLISKENADILIRNRDMFWKEND
jgi:hypothetical protein